MKNIKHWFSITMFLIIALGVGVNIYLQCAPIKIIDIHSPLKILTPNVKAGNTMIYLADYCLYKQYPATVSRNLVDDSFVPLPITNSVGDLGCHKIEVQIPVPQGTKPGIYHMTGIASYQITPNRTIDIPFYSQNFNVTQ